MYRKVIILPLIALSLAISCKKSETPKGAEDEKPVELPGMVVKTQEATIAEEFPVSIEGKEDVEIRSKISGFIQNVLVDEGAKVGKGQALFKIESYQQDNMYAKAQQAVNLAQAQLNQAEATNREIQKLCAQNILGVVKCQEAQANVQIARATHNQARNEAQIALRDKAHGTIYSPVSGVVGSLPLKKGSLVSSADLLTTVSNTSDVYAYFSLNETELTSFLNTIVGATTQEKIKNIGFVKLIMSDGQQYSHDGNIETINGQLNPTTGTARLRAIFPNPASILRSGASGNILVNHKVAKAIIVPQEATFYVQDKVGIYTLNNEGKLITKYITVKNMNDGKNYLVTSGLIEGEKIVSGNLVKAKPDMKATLKF